MSWTTITTDPKTWPPIYKPVILQICKEAATFFIVAECQKEVLMKLGYALGDWILEEPVTLSVQTDKYTAVRQVQAVSWHPVPPIDGD